MPPCRAGRARGFGGEEEEGCGDAVDDGDADAMVTGRVHPALLDAHLFIYLALTRTRLSARSS